jgi:hypothetical protein
MEYSTWGKKATETIMAAMEEVLRQGGIIYPPKLRKAWGA